MSWWRAEATNSTRRLFLVGESGAGKSTLGNRLLRRRAFAVGAGFDAVTHEVQCERTDDLEVCDTPGLNDGSRSDGETANLILDAMRARSIAGIIYVHNAKVLRLTKAAKKTMKLLLRDAGITNLADRVLFVFTRATGLGAVAKRSLQDMLCKKLDPTFCDRPPALAFAGVKNPIIDWAFFIDLRLKRATSTFLRRLRNYSDLSLAPPPPPLVDDDSPPLLTWRGPDPKTCTAICALCTAAGYALPDIAPLENPLLPTTPHPTLFPLGPAGPTCP